MLRSILVASSLLIAAVACASASPPSVSLFDHPAVASRLDLFAIWAGEQMTYRHQPGVVIGLVSRNGAVYTRALGRRDRVAGTPMTTGTAFRVGSISKLFTATAVLCLRDAGELRLDDAVEALVPGLVLPRALPDDPPVTIRHLLTHTSGLPREAGLPYWTDRAFPDRAALLAAASKLGSVASPGEGIQYSNLGMGLLGAVIEAASGMSYDRYVTAAILLPLAMTETAVTHGHIDRARLATGYLVTRPDGVQPVAPDTDSRALASAADVTSTVGDLARFVRFHLGSGAEAVLPLRTRRDMQRVHALAPSWSSGRGLGFSVWRHGDRTLVGHGGWVAGYRTQVAFDPEAGWGAIVLTNSDEGGPAVYLEQLFDYIVPVLEKIDGDALSVPSPAPGLDTYLGAYKNPWGEVTDVIVLDGQLALYGRSYPPTEDLSDAASVLEAVGEHRFRQAGNGRSVVFELDAAGDVERVKVGENYLFPVGCVVVEGLRCVSP